MMGTVRTDRLEPSHSWDLVQGIDFTPDEVDGGFVAECLDVPGAMSQGETPAEALENLIDAVQGVVAAMTDEPR